MSRLIEVDAVRKAIEKEWDGIDGKYIAKDIIDFITQAVEQVEEAKAIPIDWIEAEIKRLRAMDFEFATMTAGQIEAMLKRWKKEQG